MDAYIGEIRAFGKPIAPDGWVNCDGSSLPISGNEALFSLIGTTYGGNGSTNFNVPDLRCRIPICCGTGPGLTPRTIGSNGGSETVTLTANQTGAHAHSVIVCTSGTPVKIPLNGTSYLSSVNTPDAGASVYGYLPSNVTYTLVTMDPNTIQLAGGNSQPHNNLMPSLAINFIICKLGIYPSFT